MIDIDYNDNTSIVRSNIGDPEGMYVSDSTINSALIKTESDVVKASILIMETMLSWFLTQADETKTGQVEYKYRNLYERFKARLQEFQDKYASKFTTGIIIGGVSFEEKNRVNSDKDVFTMWMNDTYQDLMMRQRVIDEDEELRL